MSLQKPLPFPNLRINTILDEDDDDAEIGITQDFCIDIDAKPTCLNKTRASSRYSEFLSPPCVSRSLSYASTTSTSTSTSSSIPGKLAHNSSNSSTTLKSLHRPKRASTIFTFDARASPTINPCDSYFDCLVVSIWNALEQFPWLSNLISAETPIFSMYSEKPSPNSSFSMPWKSTSLFFLSFCLLIVIPSLLYIILLQASSSTVAVAHPHFAFLVADPPVPFSLYDKSEFEFKRMEMNDRWWY